MQLKNHLLNFFFPIHCAGCGDSATHCCASCLQKIRTLRLPPRDAEVVAAVPFEEHAPIAELIHRFKYDGAEDVSGILAELFPAERPSWLSAAIAIPVPLHHRRFKNRGFNQSAVLAHEIKKKWGLPVADILQRHRATRPQVELSGRERLTNLHGAFSMKNPGERLSEGLPYIIIDDVYTTGTTFRECAAVLRKHGAEKIFGLVVARTR